MSPAMSARTIRLKGLDPTISAIDFQNMAKNLEDKASGKFSFFSKSAPVSKAPQSQLQWSLCKQDETATATLTFRSPDIKHKVMKNRDASLQALDVTDLFHGLTVLHSVDEPNIDLCAVHGLGGNAFDTWMGDSKMWLRDLLPSSAQFGSSRIMTFGYDSTLVNSKSNERIQDWADELLRQVCYVRTTPEEQSRPIIYICHSLGGLVGRQAMTRLKAHPNKFDGLKLDHCGLLFLSTPHSGTTEADWNALWLSVCEFTIGVRSHEIVDQLRSFNPASVDSEDDFSAMERVPPMYCLVEGKTTKVARKERTIVTQPSAGFHGKTADKIPNTDRHTVCKFDTKFGGYMPVLDRLKRLKVEISTPGGGSSASLQNPPQFPGYPPVTAPRFPAATRWYEGRYLRNSSQLVGRTAMLDEMLRALDDKSGETVGSIALTGIGGIGKTELLLELAFRCRTSRNVFFIRAHDATSLDQAFLELAMSIGHDILAPRHPGTDIHAMWLQLGPSERINAFRTWLGEELNQPSLFIVDDIDGIPDDASIQAALPRDARCILFSTRDPSIIDSLDRECRELRITSMDVDEMESLMESVLRRSTSLKIDITERELESIAKVVDGHALGACRAISYITHVLAQTARSSPVEVFLTMYASRNWRARLKFLKYKPRFGRSIMDTYGVSLQRMRRYRDGSIVLLELIAFLSSTDDHLDFRQFLDIDRPWLAQLEGRLANFETFANGLSDKNELLAELENVSIGLRPSLSKPLQLHPLWIECTLQRASHDGRCRWLSQILLLCYESWRREEDIDILRPFMSNCVEVAERFDIDLDRLFNSTDLSHWLSDVRKPEEGSTVSEELGEITEAENEKPTLKDEELETEACYRIFCCLQDDCHDLQRRLSTLERRSAGAETATEKQQSSVTQFIILLMRLRKLQETAHKGHLAVAKIQQAHIQAYDILIDIIPLLKPFNQALIHKLHDNKRYHQQQYGMHA